MPIGSGQGPVGSLWARMFGAAPTPQGADTCRDRLPGSTSIRVPPTDLDNLLVLGLAQGAVAATLRYVVDCWRRAALRVGSDVKVHGG
jgi:hypothetical protein